MAAPWRLGRDAALLLLLAGFAGCRCGAPAEGDAGARDTGQPPMPTGMLVPIEAAPSASTAPDDPRPSRRLALTTGETGGSFVELQVPRKPDRPERTQFTRWLKTSHYVTLDALTLLHAPFARAQPGFDSFLPRYMGPYALERLVTELATFEKEWNELTSLAAAKEKWARQSTFIDGLASEAEWTEAKATLLTTVQRLSALAGARAKSDEALWVLPP